MLKIFITPLTELSHHIAAAQSLSMIWLKLSWCVPCSGSRSYCCLSGATSEKSNTWSAFRCQLCACRDSFKFSPCPALLTLTTTHVRLLLYIVTDIYPLSDAYPPYYYHNNAWWISRNYWWQTIVCEMEPAWVQHNKLFLWG